MEEIKVTLKDGSVALINDAPADKEGNKRYIVTSEDGSFDMFTYTPYGKDGDDINPSQKAALTQIISKLPE